MKRSLAVLRWVVIGSGIIIGAMLIGESVYAVWNRADDLENPTGSYTR